MAQNNRPTLQEIAEASGFAKSTVSLALRNHPRLSEATRKKIRAVAKRLGYVPNPSVAALMAHVRSSSVSRTENLIGIIHFIPGGDNRPRSRRLIRGAEERAGALGYAIDHFHLKDSGMTSKRMLGIMRTRGVRGVLLLPTQASQSGIRFDLSGFASVTVGYSILRPEIHRACNHNSVTMMTALRHLRHRGYRRVALIMPAEHDRRTSHLWVSSFLGYQWVRKSDGRAMALIEDGLNRERILKWIDEVAPDAIVSTQNAIAEWLEEAGYDLAHDMGFASVDWQPWRAEISGVDQNYEQVAASAIDLLSAQIQRNESGLPVNPKTSMVHGIWREGKTLRSAAARV